MRGLPQKQNARRADKIKLCGHLRRYKKIVKKTYIILVKFFISSILLKFPLSITSHLEKILNEKQKNKLPFLTIITFRIFLSIFIMPTPILLLPQ